MKPKLKNISESYHLFVEDQVLTANQLNEFIDYFEDQDRMSRVFLSGVGIVCGFDLKINSAKTKITIMQGAGVTTDGDLLKLQKNIKEKEEKSIDFGEIEYTHFKEFEDSNAGYSFFKKQTNLIGIKKYSPINLWEIVTAKENGSKPLSELPNIKNKVVLLYLEAYPKKGDLCTAIDCDNQGTEQVARLRVLLVSKTDANYIAGKDSIFSKHNITDNYFKLPEISVPRVVMNLQNSTNYNDLKRAYYQAINIPQNNFRTLLKDTIPKIVTHFNSLLNLDLRDYNPQDLENNLSTILNFSAYNVPLNIQYRYDCIKDIVDTYNEIKELLFELKSECCPNIKAFPKHLLLGQIDEINTFAKHNRHQFYKSPILNGGINKIEQTKSLVKRLFKIVAAFKTTTGEIKITPSNKLLQLTYRTIPFYYNLNLGLLRSWNYFKTEKNEHNTNLSYHTINSSALHIKNPLNYNIDNYDFYRIEGHQGKNYKQVLEEINKLKQRHGLAFDVKALSVNINHKNLNVDKYQCEFEDLSVLLRAWTAEQECVLAEVAGFFSGFSTATPGANVKETQLNKKEDATVVGTIVENNLLETNRTIFGSTAKYVDSSVKSSESYKITTFKKSKVITENLTIKDNSLGNVMKVAFNETEGGSVNDIIVKSKSLANEIVNTDEWKSKPEVKSFVIDNSIELMAYSHVLSRKMPGTLVDVSTEKVNTYKASMEDLCKLVKAMKSKYQKVELTAGLKAFIGIFINQLSTVCCSSKKLQVLLEEINKRKENILLRLQFSKFVDKHPGLEHKAGVQPGGTFVLVYLNKENIQEKPGVINLEKPIYSQPISENIVHFANPLAEINSGNVFELSEDKFTGMLLKPDILGGLFRPTGILNNTVVADFSLPYMCCSDCAPINFIIAKPQVSLQLEKDEFCLGKDSSPLIFEVSPADGIIKADAEIPGITIDGKKLTIDNTLFPKEMFGKTIKFTVNEQITDCEITIYRAIKFNFEVPNSSTSETEITFVPKGELKGATFLWSFGDDNLSTDRNPTHKYLLPVNDNNKVTVTVSLTVTAPNGICQTTVEHEIEFKVEEPKISLDKDNYCINDKNSYPFIVTPAGASVEIVGEGVKPNDSGVYLFIPANAKVGEISFLLNGKPSGVKITVQQAPVAKFEHAQIRNQLVLTNKSINADSFIWIIDGIDKEKDISPYTIKLQPNGQSLWKIELLAVSKLCGTNRSEVIELKTKYTEESPANNCIEETTASIKKDLAALRKLQNPDSRLVLEIWELTSKLYGRVVDDIDNYLAGKNNGKLESDFVELLRNTSNIIVKIDRANQKVEFNQLVQLFALQLRLFYNVLGCQDPAIIKKFNDIIQDTLNIIIELLQLLKDNKVTLPNSLKEFIEVYSKKVKEIELLSAHLKILTQNNLI